MIRKHTIKLLMSVLLLSLIALFMGLAVSAADTDTVPPLPYAFSNATVVDENLSISGVTCSDAIQFRMGYTGLENGYTAQVTYNFKGAYQSISFTTGYADGWERDAALTIIADGKVLYDSVTVSYQSAAKKYTIPLTGVDQLIIQYYSYGYDKTWYAIGNLSVVPIGNVPSEDALVSDEFYDIPRYFLQNTTVITENFSMGGFNYENGYKLKMGYNGTSGGYTAIVGFNFAEQYKELSFDLAKYMNRTNESYTRSAYLTIEVDGVAHPDYTKRELRWNDLVLPVKINVAGATEVKITVVSNGYDTVYWAMGNIQLVSDGKVHGILLSADKATLNSSSPSIDLNPRVYPSDIPESHKAFTIDTNSNITAIVTEDGIVYGRSKGSAEITATTNVGGYTAKCTITSNLPAAKYTPAVNGWGFNNYTSDFNTDFENYKDIYERICGCDLSYVLDEAGDILYGIQGENSLDSKFLHTAAALHNIPDFLWYSMNGALATAQCHGMAVSSALTYTGDIPFSYWKWDNTSYSNPYSVKNIEQGEGYSSKLDMDLRQFIMACHLTQFTLGNWTSSNLWQPVIFHIFGTNFDDLIEKVTNFRNKGTSPVILELKKSNLSHTILPYDVVRMPEYNEIRIYVYDSILKKDANTYYPDPNNRYVTLYTDDEGEVTGWEYNTNAYHYDQDDTSLSYAGSLSKFADRIKKRAALDTIEKIFFTTSKSFSLTKGNTTLISVRDGDISDSFEQNSVMPFVVMSADGESSLLPGTAIAILDTSADIRVVFEDENQRNTSIYYTMDSACVVESTGGTIELLPEEKTYTLKVLPAEKSNVTVRYNNTQDSLLIEGTVSEELNITTESANENLSLKGYSTMKTTLITEEETYVGVQKTTEPDQIYQTDKESIKQNNGVALGDIDRNGRIDRQDSTLLNQYFAGHPVKITESAADVDSDGSLTRKDAMILARHTAGWKKYTALPYIAD